MNIVLNTVNKYCYLKYLRAEWPSTAPSAVYCCNCSPCPRGVGGRPAQAGSWAAGRGSCRSSSSLLPGQVGPGHPVDPRHPSGAGTGSKPGHHLRSTFYFFNLSGVQWCFGQMFFFYLTLLWCILKRLPYKTDTA